MQFVAHGGRGRWGHGKHGGERGPRPWRDRWHEERDSDRDGEREDPRPAWEEDEEKYKQQYNDYYDKEKREYERQEGDARRGRNDDDR